MSRKSTHREHQPTHEHRYDKHGAVADAHQTLRKQNLLKQWTDLPLDARIIFVSHEWVGWKHPDPKGVQLGVLVDRIKYLLEHEDVELRWCDDTEYHRQIDWKIILNPGKCYLWFDWMSMPQPSAENETTCPAERLNMLKRKGVDAVHSIPAYVERCDFMMVLAPPSTHKDRIDEFTGKPARTSLRSWRRRGAWWRCSHLCFRVIRRTPY